MNNLCVFVHVPKTSGEVIKRNIENTLSKNNIVRTSFEYFEPYFDIVKQEPSVYKGREHFHQYINSLSKLQKINIKFVAGHNSYYGIHELFSEQAEYITFMRDPVLRTISLYNFERMAWDIYSKKEQLSFFEFNFLKRITDHFLINNRLPTFEQWLHEIYDQTIPFYYSMSRYLTALGFSSHEDQLLDQFHFIGTTEKHSQDASYLYDQFNIKQRNADINESIHFVSLKTLSGPTIQALIRKNDKDITLYNLAIKKNKLFKKQNQLYDGPNIRYQWKRLFNYGRKNDVKKNR